VNPPAFATARALCYRCLKGDHSQQHGLIGCTERSMSNRDRVCTCDVRQGPRALPDLPDVGEED
jgi:hypothetical protein